MGTGQAIGVGRTGVVARHGSGCQAMGGAPQIEDGGEGEVVDFVDRQRTAARAGFAVKALQGAEDGFDRRATAGDQTIAHRLPVRQFGQIAVPAVHDAVLAAGGLQQEYREFRVWAMTMGLEETSYGTTQ